MQNITGLILAGGKSRRFGSDKALHILDGKLMIEHAFDVMLSVINPVLISVGAPSQKYNLPALHIPDIFKDAGPLGGLHAGLKAAGTPWVFISTVDLPFINQTAIQLIINSISDDLDAVISKSNEQIQPLFGCYRVSLVESLERSISKNYLSATRFALSLRTTVVDLPTSVLVNVNRPADLE